MIMTAVYKLAIHKLEARKLGVRDFVEKPLDFDDFLVKIQRLIGPGKSAKSDPKEKVVFDTVPETLDDTGQIKVVPTTESEQPKGAIDNTPTAVIRVNPAQKSKPKTPSKPGEVPKVESDAAMREHFKALKRKLCQEITGKDNRNGKTLGKRTQRKQPRQEPGVVSQTGAQPYRLRPYIRVQGYQR